jgi:hypothetical protein
MIYSLKIKAKLEVMGINTVEEYEYTTRKVSGQVRETYWVCGGRVISLLEGSMASPAVLVMGSA